MIPFAAAGYSAVPVPEPVEELGPGPLGQTAAEVRVYPTEK